MRGLVGGTERGRGKEMCPIFLLGETRAARTAKEQKMTLDSFSFLAEWPPVDYNRYVIPQEERESGGGGGGGGAVW